MSSQSIPNIPNVFEDSDRAIDVLGWEDQITKNPGIYKDCFVRRFTHVKNLESHVLHEYLNVIVKDNPTTHGLVWSSNVNGNRTRSSSADGRSPKATTRIGNQLSALPPAHGCAHWIIVFFHLNDIATINHLSQRIQGLEPKYWDMDMDW